MYQVKTFLLERHFNGLHMSISNLVMGYILHLLVGHIFLIPENNSGNCKTTKGEN